MADPFSRLGTGSLLKDLQTALGAVEKLETSNAEPEVASLAEQIGDLLDIVGSFQHLATTERRNPSVHLKFRSANGLLHLQSVVACTAAIIDECSPFIPTLQSIIEGIARERDEAGYVTSDSRLENQPWYHETYQVLRLQTELLRALFTAIDLLYHQHDPHESEDGQPLEASSSTSTRLHFQIGLVDQRLGLDARLDTIPVQNALRAARAVTVYIPPVPNKHFALARPVRPYFTGRERQLANLEAAFHDTTRPSQQRFVVFGLSGSGKTELAFKFAYGHRHHFWGVFFVDGSSRKNASSSYAEIATLGGVEPNEKAAKNWLMTRALPWLLIIDNVDDEEINVDQLLPQGAKGCVLITTRNPAHVTYGNAGERYMELRPMEPDEAEVLIIKAAEEPRPWPKSVVDSAGSICHALGFLPLALVQAAKAILKGICEWPEYLEFYDRQIQRIRRTMRGRGRSVSGERKRMEDDNSSMNVFSTYEILYESLELSPKEKYQDAVELLHVFSFFHFQNIRIDVLISAAINPLKEEEQQSRDSMQESELYKKLVKPPRKSWIMFLREVRAFVLGKLATPLPLPTVLRNRDGLGMSSLEDDVHVRLRLALSVLIERSLVTRQDRATGCYSMHRLVHKWVRERPEMSTSHQALWCQVSMTTLASSIRRPPHGDTDKESHARREILPHIRHACECQAALDKRLEETIATVRPIWPLKKTYGRLQAEQDVRFSRVYAETGHFEDARELQERALDFVSARLGADHPLAIWLSLFLTKTLWEMSEMDNATRRQRQARALCVNAWGEDHPLTLDVTDLLGSALYMKGRWAEATALHTGNVEAMTKLYGTKHEKTLRSIRNLGRLYYRYMDYDKATGLYQTAWDGMVELLGETHLETLISLEDLAMSYLRHEDEVVGPRPKEYLSQSYDRMTFVYEQRKTRLGAEHPYTLLAILYLARIKSALGRHKEAEAMIRDGLKIAERNFGKDHIAILMAKTIHAEVLTKMRSFVEAEGIFYKLVDKAPYSQLVDADGDHPDRLTNLWLLSKCLEQQGKSREELTICEEFLSGLATIGGNGLGMTHKMRPKMEERIVRLRARVALVAGDVELGEGSLEEANLGLQPELRPTFVKVEEVNLKIRKTQTM